MEQSSLRSEIIKYVKDVHKSENVVPSTTELVKNISGLRSARHLYEIFSSIEEICKAARVPIPTARIRRTNKARERGRSSISGCHKVHLSEKQTNRVLGISQLEGGKDIDKIIDDLLDNDTALRREAKLSTDDIKIAATFVSSALRIGWPPEDLIPFVTDLGINGIGWLEAEDVRFLIKFANSIKANGWNLSDFVREARDSKSALNLFYNYKIGTIPVAEMARILGVRH